MAVLDLKKPFTESIAPNQDTVRDAVNPLKGLAEIGGAITELTNVLERMQKSSVFADANTRNTAISVEVQEDFTKFSSNLDMSDIDKAGDAMKGYIDGSIRGKYENFLSSIPDREVRNKFRTHAEHTLQNMHLKRLQTLVAREKQSADNLIITQNKLEDSFKLDSSDASYQRALQTMQDHSNSQEVPLEYKHQLYNESKDKLSRSKVIAEYNKNPSKFGKVIDVVTSNQSKPNDPTSIPSLAKSAGDNNLEVADNLNISIGDAAWDNLDSIKRRELLTV